jgi:hypothetical protein
MSGETPPPYSGDNQSWAEDLADYLMRVKPKINFKTQYDAANEDGRFVWDSSSAVPVVTKANDFVNVILAKGNATLPSSAAGLASGDLYVDASGFLKVVP